MCATHVPRANLLYSPRNKILATSLLIEAFLYEEQTRRGVSLKHWEEFEDVADHCTVCHKCLSPCPVKIDFGDVSMNMRNLLRKMGKKSFRPGNRRGDADAQRHQPADHQAGAKPPWWAWASRRSAWPTDLLKPAARKQTNAPPATVGAAPLKEQVIHFINKKMPGGLPKKHGACAAGHRGQELRADHPRPAAHHGRDRGGVLLSRLRLGAPVQPGGPGHPGHAVARRRADGAAARLPVLRLPAARFSGQFDKAEKIITDNRVLFHRVANTLNYLDIKTVVVSCGTCYDQLQGYKFEDIFPGCRIVDIHEYLLEKGITLPGAGSAQAAGYLYHDPCHSPMKQQEPMKTVQALMGPNVLKSERCCGESGTLGVTRPDIATQVRFRKEEEMRQGEAALRARMAASGGAAAAGANLKILTSCPSCLQGLSRYQDDLASGLLEADYIVVEMARQILGEQWLPQYVQRANTGGIERVLV